MSGQEFPRWYLRGFNLQPLYHLWRRGPESNRPTRICNQGSARSEAKATGRQGRAWRAWSARFALCWAISSPLLGCGGGGDPPPASVAPCVPVAVLVQLEGDSVAFGSGATDPANTPENLIRAALVKRWPTGVSVVMTAVGGSTSFNRINGADLGPDRGVYLPFPQGVVGNVYLTDFGGNDARHGESVAQFKDNIRKIASVPGAILETPIPLNPAAPLSEGASTALYAQAVREVGAELGVPVADVQAYVLSLPNWQALTAPDLIHPSDALYRMMVANVILPAVVPVVAKLRCE